MSRKYIFWIVLLFFVASLDIALAQNIEKSHGLQKSHSQLHDKQEALETLRAFTLPKEDYDAIVKQKSKKRTLSESVLAYLFCKSTDQTKLERWCKYEQQAEPECYADFTKAVDLLLADAVYFPVPQSKDDADAFVTYENSWQYERTYGGISAHEGCDIMAGVQQRGYYPVLSVSDGTVEKIGWLPKGGYRIGVRSPSGVYYYYAHLAEYEPGMTQGTTVAAGQLLGYMGDTGYSEIEGTCGNFPIHLHFGMYLNDNDGQEISFNTYYLLQILEDQRLTYQYGCVLQGDLRCQAFYQSAKRICTGRESGSLILST